MTVTPPPEPGDAHLAVTLEGALDGLAPMRRQVRAVLGAFDVGGDDADDVVLVLNELVTNAIEHGHRGVASPVRIDVDIRAADLGLTVIDRGSWVDDPPQAHRGRGLDIARALASGPTDVHRSAHGTEVSTVLPRHHGEAALTTEQIGGGSSIDDRPAPLW
jgi:anti-sigma regulatory factor (Ser/Thr protein kinase)